MINMIWFKWTLNDSFWEIIWADFALLQNMTCLSSVITFPLRYLYTVSTDNHVNGLSTDANLVDSLHVIE